MSDEIGQVYRGMMVALPPEEWAIFRHMSLKKYVAFLKQLAGNVNFEQEFLIEHFPHSLLFIRQLSKRSQVDI
jgi:hypothetical protein